MTATWEHPDLGPFEFEKHIGWRRTIMSPAFADFVYDDGEIGAPPPGTHEFSFDAKDPSELPSPSAVALGGAVVRNQQTLAVATRAALWDDLNDRGPDSGMWWHGDLPTVTERGTAYVEQRPRTSTLPPLESADALNGWMRLIAIRVRASAYRCVGPVVELSFRAAIDAEHGVSVLTDGQRILGTGYECTVSCYEHPESTRGQPAAADNQPMQRTGAAGIVSRVRKWFGRGSGR